MGCIFHNPSNSSFKPPFLEGLQFSLQSVSPTIFIFFTLFFLTSSPSVCLFQYEEIHPELQGRVCEGGPSRPCAHGLQVHMFADLARVGARLDAAKNDAAAGLGRNVARVRLSRARL
jgi:hypothetical protein